MGSSCSSLYPHVSAQLALEGFMREFVLGTFMVNYPENSNLVKIGKKKLNRALYTKT